MSNLPPAFALRHYPEQQIHSALSNLMGNKFKSQKINAEAATKQIFKVKCQYQKKHAKHAILIGKLKC